MSRALITLNSLEDRQTAIRWIQKVPLGTRVELKEARRTLSQNSKLWATMTELSTQLRWHGHKLTPDQWKSVLMSGLKHERKVVPNINGDGVVDLGYSSSDLSKDEMSELIELALALGTQNGVKFRDEPPMPEPRT